MVGREKSGVQHALKNLEGWDKELSKDLQTEVIIASAQSNAGFYHFSLYRKGEMTREIEYCYGADYETINIGERFDFEDEQPGKKVEYNGEVDFIFDFDSIEEYSKHFGLVVPPDHDNIQDWEILKLRARQKTLGDFRLETKLWWKFRYTVAYCQQCIASSVAELMLCGMTNNTATDYLY